MQPNHQSRPASYRSRLGIGLLFAPILLILIASASLYAWIIVNGYELDGSVMSAWLVYVITFLAYFGPFVVGASLVLMIVGLVLLVTKE